MTDEVKSPEVSPTMDNLKEAITNTTAADRNAASIAAADKQTTEERLETLELAIKQLATDISTDIHHLAQQNDAQDRILAGVYSMAMAAQVLAETVARYNAGYKPGDFAQDVEAALSSENPNGISLKAMNDSPFDAAKFMELVKESAEAFMKIKEHEMKKHREENTKAQSNIIQMPEKKIIVP